MCATKQVKVVLRIFMEYRIYTHTQQEAKDILLPKFEEIGKV